MNLFGGTIIFSYSVSKVSKNRFWTYQWRNFSCAFDWFLQHLNCCLWLAFRKSLLDFHWLQLVLHCFQPVLDYLQLQLHRLLLLWTLTRWKKYRSSSSAQWVGLLRNFQTPRKYHVLMASQFLLFSRNRSILLLAHLEIKFREFRINIRLIYRGSHIRMNKPGKVSSIIIRMEEQTNS